jgi:hypothetical protein
MSLVGSLRGVQANAEPCNSNSNILYALARRNARGRHIWPLKGQDAANVTAWYWANPASPIQLKQVVTQRKGYAFAAIPMQNGK